MSITTSYSRLAALNYLQYALAAVFETGRFHSCQSWPPRETPCEIDRIATAYGAEFTQPPVLGILGGPATGDIVCGLSLSVLSNVQGAGKITIFFNNPQTVPGRVAPKPTPRDRR